MQYSIELSDYDPADNLKSTKDINGYWSAALDESLSMLPSEKVIFLMNTMEVVTRARSKLGERNG